MRQIIDRLFVGDLGDCRDIRPAGMAVIHACRQPCHAGYCAERHPGETVDASHASYLSVRSQDGQELYLNLIDPPTPLFRADSFRAFLAFASERWKAGNSLLIHCNQGRSRAPSLALVFMAKALRALPNESFDQAWDVFEQVAGPYTPGAGIETWLRENWHKIDAEPVAFIDGAAPKPAQQHAEIPAAAQVFTEGHGPATPLDSLASIYGSPFVHFYAGARIRDKDDFLTPMDGHTVPHVFQASACEAYEWSIANGVPVRLILGPKARQSGISTIASELCYHHTMRFRCSGMMIGDENSRTDLLWKMFNEMADNDRFKSIWKARHTYNSEKAHFTYDDADGVEQKLEWLRDTASDNSAGSSGTRQILWFSECGRYGKDGKVTDLQVISNASSSVPDKPGTMIIMESTAEGASGVFYSRVQGAVTLEQRMRGEIGNGWIKVFCAWHACPDYMLPRTVNTEGWFKAPLDEEEKAGVSLYGWTAEQIAWRRSKIEGQFEGNLNLFKQEYPSSEAEAFQSSGTPRFDLKGIARLQKMALIGHGMAKYGALEENNNLITFLAAHETPWLWVREEPMYGNRYIFSTDCMTGVQSAGSLKRDTHGPGIWRLGYMDTNQVWHNTELVAAVHVPPDGCRWDEDVLARRTHLMSKWYGNCIMVPEVNEAGGYLRELINLRANLWERTKPDEAAGIVGATLKIPGWKTTGGSGGTRNLIVAQWAKEIREQTVDIRFQPMVNQLATFVNHPNGSCSAKTGCMDDFVMGGGIGLVCQHVATTMKPPQPVMPSVHLPDPGGYRGKGSGAMG